MAKRLGKLQAFLREQKLDALLIKSKTMKKYMDTLTGSGYACGLQTSNW